MALRGLDIYIYIGDVSAPAGSHSQRLYRSHVRERADLVSRAICSFELFRACASGNRSDRPFWRGGRWWYRGFHRGRLDARSLVLNRAFLPPLISPLLSRKIAKAKFFGIAPFPASNKILTFEITLSDVIRFFPHFLVTPWNFNQWNFGINDIANSILVIFA